jgi:DHA2 family multidrug resistance protein
LHDCANTDARPADRLADAGKGARHAVDIGIIHSQIRAHCVREAQTQSFSDVFLLIMVTFIVATLMVPLMKKIVPPKAAPPDAH